MSRLDDELRIAFKRKEPSVDFAARVLERINETPAPKAKETWRQALARFFDPPKLRWVAIGVAASLLLAIGVGGYLRLNREAVEDSARVAGSIAVPETVESSGDKDERLAAPVLPYQNAPQQIIKKRDVTARVAKNQARIASARKQQPISAEAEAAKEQVLFALQIVGSTLSDAQKVIQDDDRKLTPEPAHNR